MHTVAHSCARPRARTSYPMLLSGPCLTLASPDVRSRSGAHYSMGTLRVLRGTLLCNGPNCLCEATVAPTVAPTRPPSTPRTVSPTPRCNLRSAPMLAIGTFRHFGVAPECMREGFSTVHSVQLPVRLSRQQPQPRPRTSAQLLPSKSAAPGLRGARKRCPNYVLGKSFVMREMSSWRASSWNWHVGNVISICRFTLWFMPLFFGCNMAYLKLFQHVVPHCLAPCCTLQRGLQAITAPNSPTDRIAQLGCSLVCPNLSQMRPKRAMASARIRWHRNVRMLPSGWSAPCACHSTRASVWLSLQALSDGSPDNAPHARALIVRRATQQRAHARAFPSGPVSKRP